MEEVPVAVRSRRGGVAKLGAGVGRLDTLSNADRSPSRRDSCSRQGGSQHDLRPVERNTGIQNPHTLPDALVVQAV